MITYNNLREDTPFYIQIWKIVLSPKKKHEANFSPFTKRTRQTFTHHLGDTPSPTLPPKIPQIGTQNTVIQISYEPLPRTQKTPENAHSMGFSGVRKSIFLRSLLIHLCCYLSRKILFLLLQPFACFKTYKTLYSQLAAFCLCHVFHILTNCLFIFSLYIFLF